MRKKVVYETKLLKANGLSMQAPLSVHTSLVEEQCHNQHVLMYEATELCLPN